MQEKIITIEDIKINYKIIGIGKTPILLLHGWGLSSDKYIKLAQKAINKNKDLIFYIPDLPGFGKSDEPNNDWDLNNYVKFTKDFTEKVVKRKGGFEIVKNILEKAVKNKGANISFSSEKKISILAHSFGGRIAIKYVIKYPNDLEKLFLTGAAGIKHPLSKKKKIIFYTVRIGKFFLKFLPLKILEKNANKLLYGIIKEKDYKNASTRMKNVMKNVLKEDLTNILEKIKIRTILIWGENDNSTPLSDGKIMKIKIENSELFTIKNANHSVPYNNINDFSKIFIDNL